ncbi:MAG: threonine synthase [Bacteroidota bacterium]
MKLYSTNNKGHIVNLKEAVLRGLPPDNGLYMPTEIPLLPDGFIETIENYDIKELAFEVCKTLFNGFLPLSDLEKIVNQAVSFPAPLKKLNEELFILELFHGPSLAFKDFGARFMAQLMSYFNQNESKELVILVATSGDTGGAVASGFYKTEGIKVVILYPSGKVSPLQEKQLTTLGHNITALEIDGTFDDCQAIVKKAFLDPDLINFIRLTSANSINIARLIPQSFYYFEAYKQAPKGHPINYCIPSGNFGNLTAGLFAHKMGMPAHQFIAATNANDIVPQYLETGKYLPKPSVRTLSNAMDVGNPSNFNRMLDYFYTETNGSTWNNMKEKITGYAFNDVDTAEAMREIKDKYDYIIDPHGAVGHLAIKKYKEENRFKSTNVLLETAHPAKFLGDVERILDEKIEIPLPLKELEGKTKSSIKMDKHYSSFKEWIKMNY